MKWTEDIVGDDSFFYDSGTSLVTAYENYKIINAKWLLISLTSMLSFGNGEFLHEL